MKRTSKKLLSLLIALLMVVSLLPVAALAVEDYGLLVNGVAVTSENADDLSGLPGVTVASGGWLRYNADQNTLYAKDATIAPPEPSAMPSDYAGAVRRTSEDKLTVVSEGVNSFTADDGYSAISGLELQIALSQGSELNCFAGGFAYDESAIYPGVIGAGKEDGNDDYHSRTDLTISGPGKLNVSSVIPDDSSYYYAYGILAFAGISIDNGAVVNVTVDADDGSYALGICADYGDLNVTGSDVTVNAVGENGDADAVYAYGAAAFTDSTLNATADADDDAYGIYSSLGDISFTDCETVSVTANGDYAYVIYCYYGGVQIDGCENFTVTITDGGYYSYGICSYYGEDTEEGVSAVTVKDSKVTVSINALDEIYGIFSDDGSVGIINSTVTVTTVTEYYDEGDVYGAIYGDYGVSITDGSKVSVSASGTCCAYGVVGYYGPVEISDSILTVSSSCTEDAYGIYSDSAVSIIASDVTVTTDGYWDSDGIYADDGITITDAELVVPEGGTYDGCYVYDAEDNIADYVVILGYKEPAEPEPFVEGYWVKLPKEITNGTATASAVAAGEGDEITFTLKPDKGYLIDGPTVTDDARRPIDFTDNGDGSYTFVMPASDAYINFRFYRDLPFEDVDPDDYFYDAVAYLYDNGITKGTSETTFEPEGVCTRAETVTLLWRMMGEPEPTSADCPFEDVAPDAYYYKAVLWAAENGVTLGTSETTFEPDLKVQRAMTVTFLYRALKLQGKGFEGAWAFELDFTDKDAVPEWSYESFCWMVMNEIVQGADGKLLPLEPCTRGQIAAMLYRTLA
ncbi:MAG: S-layer homology domain-containing protein [Oscillospiraceae bacterium]|nr:S-layer homology domain-containing protein [Oscillospiraceae bacterium]